jgi:hypothetical protein
MSILRRFLSDVNAVQGMLPVSERNKFSSKGSGFKAGIIRSVSRRLQPFRFSVFKTFNPSNVSGKIEINLSRCICNSSRFLNPLNADAKIIESSEYGYSKDFTLLISRYVMFSR